MWRLGNPEIDMKAPQTHFDDETHGYVALLPSVTRAAYAYWVALDGAVPLEWLLERGSAELRGAVLREEPLVLDFGAAVLEELAQLRSETREKEAA